MCMLLIIIFMLYLLRFLFKLRAMKLRKKVKVKHLLIVLMNRRNKSKMLARKVRLIVVVSRLILRLLLIRFVSTLELRML